jgi:hypothetical protein
MPSSWELSLCGTFEGRLDPTWLHAVVSRRLDDYLPEKLKAQAKPGVDIRLGRHSMTVAAAPRLITVIPWGELHQDTNTRSWWTTFLTPTTFRLRNRSCPWPAPLRNTQVSGFVGKVRYVCDGDQALAAAFEALLRFAEYAGIGSHTAFGLGAVRISRGRCPRGAHPTSQATRLASVGDPPVSLGLRPVCGQ